MLASIENEVVNEAIIGWSHVAPLLTKPETGEEYESMVAALDLVLDAGGADEKSELAPLADIMGDLVAEYDEEHYAAIQEASGFDVLKQLMVEHGLKQSDLHEIGTQGVVSEVLSGRRSLNVRQIKSLSQRFGVPAGMFV